MPRPPVANVAPFVQQPQYAQVQSARAQPPVPKAYAAQMFSHSSQVVFDCLTLSACDFTRPVRVRATARAITRAAALPRPAVQEPSRARAQAAAAYGAAEYVQHTINTVCLLMSCRALSPHVVAGAA